MVAIPSLKSFATPREMVWVQRERFMGWACSECAWEFIPSGFPAGNTIAEMKDRYERQRDKEFDSHVCREVSKPQQLNSQTAPFRTVLLPRINANFYYDMVTRTDEISLT